MAMLDPNGDTSRGDQRTAAIRVFGGTALAFVALLAVLLVMRPDLMQSAYTMLMAMMH